MKQTIITILLALVAVAMQAQKPVVWETPSAFMGSNKGRLQINKVELKPTETVLHLSANYTPESWIRFAKASYLQTPDGTKYAITGGAKTNEGETDLYLDSLFYLTKSGKANLALHFNPVPLTTKEMDFLEGLAADDFKFWSISDSKTKKKLVLPDEWKNVAYAKDETLPTPKIGKGTATIKVKMLGYKPGMGLNFYVGGFTPLGATKRFDKLFAFADDGTVKIEVPLWMTREVTVGVVGMSYPNIIIAPGQVTEILMKMTSDGRPFVAFKGFMAKTNMDMVDAYNTFEPDDNDKKTYMKVKDCQTPAERLQCLTDLFDQRVKAYQKTKYTTAAKDLLCMAAEEDYVEWTRQFAVKFTPLEVDEDGNVSWNYMNLSNQDLVKKNAELLSLSPEEMVYTWKYLNEPASPCCLAFWETVSGSYDPDAKAKNAFNADIRMVPTLLATTDMAVVEQALNEMTSEDCKAIVRESQAEQLRIAQQLAAQESIFYKKYDDIAPENILQTILDRYKGKAVLIDIWATWCGPCRAGHKAMKPMKDEMKGQNVQFVYITSPTSPLATWQEMLKEIDGDHYYLTKEQYNYILQKYESNGIPTYAIYDTQGRQTYKSIGFPGNDVIRAELEKAAQ